MRRWLAVLAAGLLGVAAAGSVAVADEAGLRIQAVDASVYPHVEVVVGVPGGVDDADLPDGLRVLEDGAQIGATVTEADSADLEVVLLIDTTGSMGGGPMEAAKDAATRFLETLPDDTRAAVVGYDADTTVVAGFEAPRSEHVDGVAGLAADGRTAMYDAVATVLDDVLSEPQPGDRQAIVLLTDGEDNESSTTLDDLAERLETSDVLLQGVEYQTAFSDEAGIRRLAEATGGTVQGADEPDALVSIYEQLAADLVDTYEIGYLSEGTGSVEVTVELDRDGTTLSDTRIVDLPSDVPPVGDRTDGDEDDEVTAVVAEPRGPLTWVGLIGGAVAWFVALFLLLLALFAPREGRAQLAGAASRAGRGRSGVQSLAERATLVTEEALDRRGYTAGLNAALERAGIDLRPAEFVIVVLSAALGAFAVGFVLSGAIAGLILTLIAVVVAKLFVSIKADRRQSAFAEQLSDTLQLLSGSLRAGYSLMQAIDAVAREADAPTCEEFGRLVVETRLGRDTGVALQAMAERMDSEDFGWVIQAIEIHREVGGDLAEVLDTVSGTIRERDQIRRQIKALSAEGRLSAWVLLALPFGVGGFIFLTNRPYLAELVNGGLLGWVMVGTGAVLMTGGVVWLRKLVRLEF
jgi:tight adherence protein B